MLAERISVEKTCVKLDIENADAGLIYVQVKKLWQHAFYTEVFFQCLSGENVILSLLINSFRGYSHMIQKLLLFVGLLCIAVSASLSGYVRLPDQSPVSGVQIKLYSSNKTAMTDVTGYFVFDNEVALPEQALSAQAVSVSGNSILLNLTQSTFVAVDVFNILGKRVGGFSKVVSGGSSEISPLSSNVASGIYLSYIQIGEERMCYRMKKTKDGVTSVREVKNVILAKSLAIADSLILSYENQKIGSVVIWDDESSVGDIYITHKIISGSIPSSASFGYAVNVSLSGSDGAIETISATVNNFSKTYLATSSWQLYNRLRTWTINANESSVFVSDSLQTITLNIVENVSLSSSSVGTITSSSSGVTSYTLQTMYDTQPSSIWKFVDWVWKNRQSSGHLDDIERSSNLIFHQIIQGKGKINYCVRWQSTNSLTYDQRRKTEKMLNSMLNKWVKELVGYESWPYDTVEVKVVGWAADNASKFPDATSDEKIFTSYTENDQSFPNLTLPRCPDDCARPLHYSEKNFNYSSCPIGERFDMSLWVTDGFYGGAGGDWGQRGSYNDFISGLSLAFPHIIGHETGHGFGLDDFYENYQIPNTNYDDLTCYDYKPCSTSGYTGNWDIVPKMVMWSGSASEITATDAWMLRRTWTGIKNQFGY